MQWSFTLNPFPLVHSFLISNYHQSFARRTTNFNSSIHSLSTGLRFHVEMNDQKKNWVKTFLQFSSILFSFPFPLIFFSSKKSFCIFSFLFFILMNANVQCRSPALNCIICVLRSLLVQWILLRIHEWACDTSETRILSRIGFLYFTLIYFEKKKNEKKFFLLIFFSSFVLIIYSIGWMEEHAFVSEPMTFQTDHCAHEKTSELIGNLYVRKKIIRNVMIIPNEIKSISITAISLYAKEFLFST